MLIFFTPIQRGLGSALTLLFLGLAQSFFAQNIGDALRYSTLSYGGTARFVGTGSSMGAIGADLGAVSTNPAGLGLFRKSEYAFTPSLLLSNASSRLLSGPGNATNTAERSVFNLQSAGAVFTSQPRSADWKGINFGITANHLANFNQEFTFSGSSVGTLAQRFQEIANSRVGLDDFETDLANETSLIYDFQNDGTYDIDYEVAPTALLERQQNVRHQGSMTELGFTFAGNYQEKVMIGLSIGIPFFSFTSDKTYFEVDPGDNGGSVPYFSDLNYRERLTTDGAGINAKLGVILRPIQAFRIGASIQTPTAFLITDEYAATLVNNYYEDEREQGDFLGKEASASGSFEYTLQTPWRFTGSAGLVFGKAGFLNAEVEYVDFANLRFRYNDFPADEQLINDEINQTLQSAINVRLGGEIAMDVFRFRAGIGVQPAPFRNDDTRQFTYSAGFGVREKDFYVDLAYRRLRTEEQYYPYLTARAPIQEVRNIFEQSQILMTLGFKF